MKRGDESAVNQAEWDRVKTRLKQEFGESAFKSWVIPITATAMRDGEVELSVPTRFMRDWVVKHYADRIRTLWANEDASCDSVEIVVATAAPAPTRVRPAARDGIGIAVDAEHPALGARQQRRAVSGRRLRQGL